MSAWPPSRDDPSSDLSLADLRLGGPSPAAATTGSAVTPAGPPRAYSAFGGGALHSAFGGGLFFQQHAASPPTADRGSWESAQAHPSPAQPQRPQTQQQSYTTQQHPTQQPQQQQSFPGLFGLGASQQPPPHQQPPQPSFSREAFDARFGAPSSSARGPSMPPHLQQQQQQQQQFHDHPTHNASAPPQHSQSQSQQPQGRSILNEVMSLMAPQPPGQQGPPHMHMQQQQQQQQQQGFNGPNHPQQQNGQPPRGFPPQAQPSAPLRPPLSGGARAPMQHQQGPPGFKAPPGFAMQPPPQQQQPMQHQHQLGGFGGPPPGMSSSVSPPFAVGAPSSSPLPQPLQGESHVQCSICRVVVLNTPQTLFMHDNSPLHVQNDLRMQQSRQQQMQQQQQQQQQQPQQEMRQLPPHQQPPMQQQFQDPSHSPPSHSPQLQPSPASGSPLLSPALGGGGAPLPPLDLPSLQAQLRSFMAAQEEARVQGRPPLVMDPNLLNQLKLMQNLYQQPQQQQQQQMQRKQSNGEEQGPVDAAVAAAAALTASCTASGGHIYPSRAALIAAASEIHLRPMHRNASGRMHGSGRVAVPQGMESELRRLLPSLQPDPRTFEVREELRSMIERIVQAHWGKDRCRVMLFGSSVNTLCETNSDVDLCLEFKPDPAASAASAASSSDDASHTISTASVNKPEIVETLAGLLQDSMREILALPKARVPIVKFKAPPRFDSLDCDVGINNHLAVRNSLLIRDYMSLDPRARDLTRLVKHWAKLRKINDTYRGTLSSYAYVVLVIHFLQNTSPPILPVLQSPQTRSKDSPPCIIDGFDCWYQTDLSLFSNFGSANPASLSELVVGFFKLYASEFDYKENILSIRVAPGYLDKKHKFCVEDPFDTLHDLGRGVDPAALYEIRGEFMRAFSTLREGGSILDVCSPFTKQWRGS